jgi:hypothetical protein
MMNIISLILLQSLTWAGPKTDLVTVEREIKSKVKGIEGVQTKVVDGKVTVDGQVLLPQDIKLIRSVVEPYGALATSNVTLSVIAQNKIAKFIETKIGNPKIQVRPENGKFALEGTADTQQDKTKAESVAKKYLGHEDAGGSTGATNKPVADSQLEIVNRIEVKSR